MEFKTHTKDVIKDVAKYITQYCTENQDCDMEIWVGCDSERRRGKSAEYAVALCFYRYNEYENEVKNADGTSDLRIIKVGKGAHVIHRKEFKKITGAGTDIDDFVRKRLWGEVELSFEVAEYLKKMNLLKKEKTDEYYKPIWDHVKKFLIHIDFNGKAGGVMKRGKKVRSTKKNTSNDLYDSAIWESRRLGYDCIAKPDGFAATYAADNLL